MLWSMSSFSQMIHGLAVTVENAQSALPVPATGSDGADITTIRSSGFATRDGEILIDGSTGITLSGVVKLYGYVTSRARWYLVATLNDAADIALTAAVGYGQRVFDVGTYDRLALAATVSAGTVTVAYVPIEDQGS